MRPASLLVKVSIGLTAAVLVSCGSADDGSLLCFVGGTMRPAMEALVKEYQKKDSLKVNIDYAESGDLFVRIDQTHKGDLFVCHDPFGGASQKKGYVLQQYNMATLDPVIVVAKGNPKEIHGLKDLTNPGLKVLFTHEMYHEMTLVPRMADKAGIKKALEANCTSFTWGGGESANELELGTADASIVWNAVAFLRQDKVDMIPIEKHLHLQGNVDAVTCATFGTVDLSTIKVTMNVLKFSKHAEKAKKFAEFCASDEAQKIWTDYGFSPKRETFVSQE